MNIKSQIVGAALSVLALSCSGGTSGTSSSNQSALRISGLIGNITGQCPAVSFQLGSKAVATNANSAFPAGSCSDLRNGAAIEVEGEWQSDGSVVAQRVRPQPRPPQVHIEGTLSGLQGSCPNLTFLLGTEHVLTNADTHFEEVSCGSIANGQFFEVHGVRQADGTVLAREVESRREAEEIEVIGTLASLNGTCPDVTFSLGSERITTDANTRFKGLTCGSLQNGQLVRIEGTYQAGGGILAREVQAETEDGEIEIRAVIGSLSGSCPNLTFMLGNSSVVTDSNTSFEELSCNRLGNGLLVKVEGIRRPDQSILAREVDSSDHG